MRSRTLHRCWKCGLNIRHYRKTSSDFMSEEFRLMGRVHYKRYRSFGPAGHKFRRWPLVPIKHLVEKNGHFEICKGSNTGK